MLEVNAKDMLNQVVEDIQRYPTENIDIRVNRTSGEITLTTSKYKLDIIINKRWVGYDFSLNKDLTDNIPQGSAADTDLYALDYDIRMTREIFSETRRFIAALLSDKLYYGVIDKKAVFARPNDDKEYDVTLIPRRRFLVTIQQEEWSADKVKHNPHLTKLIANEA